MGRRDQRMRWTASEKNRVPALLPDGRRAIRGITTRDLGVVFQPIVDLSSGRVRALEALVRCEWEEYRAPPALFTQAVEEESVGRLGRLIREVAFRLADGKPLFVNIHPAELSSRWLVRPDDPLCFYDNEVFLEITESATFEHFELCHDVLVEVCSRTGAHLVVDDLGAGYSNLKRIVDLEPGVVKLDISLVKGLDRNPRQQILVHQLVRLAEGLGAQVVAEGIETLDELKAVRDTGAHFGQGYLLARPVYPSGEVHWPL